MLRNRPFITRLRQIFWAYCVFIAAISILDCSFICDFIADITFRMKLKFETYRRACKLRTRHGNRFVDNNGCSSRFDDFEFDLVALEFSVFSRVDFIRPEVLTRCCFRDA